MCTTINQSTTNWPILWSSSGRGVSNSNRTFLSSEPNILRHPSLWAPPIDQLAVRLSFSSFPSFFLVAGAILWGLLTGPIFLFHFKLFPHPSSTNWIIYGGWKSGCFSNTSNPEPSNCFVFIFQLHTHPLLMKMLSEKVCHQPILPIWYDIKSNIW